MKKLILLTALFITSASIMLAQPAHNSYYGGSNGGNVGYNSGYDTGPPAMNQQDFQRALRSIQGQAYESSKLSVARQSIRHQAVRADQVRRIVMLFGYESTRLQFAKDAFPMTVDPQNYHLVSSALRYSSSQRDLDMFIAQQTGQGGAVLVNNQLPGSSTTYSGGVVPADMGFQGGGNVGINHGAADGQGYGGGHHGGNGYGGGPYGGNGYGQPIHTPAPAPVAMCVSEFARLKQSIMRQCFDRDKLLIAKQGTRGQVLYASQVLEIMGLLTFESSKLDWAKHAYLQVCDTHNYYIVNDGFTFSSSIRELECYIRSV